MSLFNRQRDTIRYSMRDKLRFAWNITGIGFVVVIAFILFTNFARPILRVPTAGVVQLDVGRTVLVNGQNRCVTNARTYGVSGTIWMETNQGRCN